MTATHPTNNDPNDQLSLDCIGFDVAVPENYILFHKAHIPQFEAAMASEANFQK
jgi:hypothetical protein